MRLEHSNSFYLNELIFRLFIICLLQKVEPWELHEDKELGR